MTEPPRPTNPETSGSTASDAPADSNSQHSENLMRGVATSLRLLAVGVAIAVLKFAAPVLMPIVLALLLFYALDPVVDRLERWHLPRGLASIIVVAALLGAVVTGAYLLWPQIESVVVRVPESAERLRATFRSQRVVEGDSPIEKLKAAAKALDSAAAEATEPPTDTPGVMRVEVQQPLRISDWLWSGGVGALGLAGQAVTILFLTVFLLYEDDSFKRKLVRRMDTMGSRRVTVQILNDIAQQIEGFIWVQALTSGFVAVVTGAVLWWLGIEEPAVWGLFAGIMNVVPYFGPLVVTAVLAVVGFVQFGTFQMAGLVAGIALAITSFEGMFLTPHLLSKAASLNHVAIFLAIAFWSWAWGVPGMLLAVPMLMAIKAACDHIPGLDGIADFLGETSSR